MLGLNCYVVKAKLFIKVSLTYSEHSRCGRFPINDDVRAHRCGIGIKRPDMDMVSRHNALNLFKRSRYLIDIDPIRRPLKKDIKAVPQQIRHGVQDNECNAHRKDRVNQLKFGYMDQETASNDRNTACGINGEMKKRPFYVQIIAIPKQKRGRNYICNHADHADEDHNLRIDIGGILDAAVRIVENVSGDPSERGSVEQSGENLSAIIAVCSARVRGFRRNPCREEGEYKTRAVGEHMEGFGQQGERV